MLGERSASASWVFFMGILHVRTTAQGMNRILRKNCTHQRSHHPLLLSSFLIFCRKQNIRLPPYQCHWALEEVIFPSLPKQGNSLCKVLRKFRELSLKLSDLDDNYATSSIFIVREHQVLKGFIAEKCYQLDLVPVG